MNPLPLCFYLPAAFVSEYVNACKEAYDHLLTAVPEVFVPSTENWAQNQTSLSQEDIASKQQEGVKT